MVEAGHTSDMVVGWVDDTTGNIDIHAYAFTQRLAPSDYSPLLNVSATSATQFNGGTTIYFTRTLMAGAQPITTSSLFVIGAFSGAGDDFLDNHGLTSHSSSGYFTNFYTGKSTVVLTIRDAHAIIMLLAWGLCLPVGLLAARYLRSFPNALWFKIHRPLQYVGTFLGFIGIIIGYSMVTAQFVHSAHATIGTIIMVFSFFQVLVAFFRPHKDPDHPVSNKRIAFELFHHWNGRGLVLLAIVQIYLGIFIDYYLTNPWLIPLYGAIVGTALLVVLILEIKNSIEPFGKLVPCYIWCCDEEDKSIRIK